MPVLSHITGILFGAVVLLIILLSRPLQAHALAHHRPQEDPTVMRRVRWRRRSFAVLRIVQVSLFVLSVWVLTLALTLPTSPGMLGKELYFLAWSSSEAAIVLAQTLALGGVCVTIISILLKRRWFADLQGWIE